MELSQIPPGSILLYSTNDLVDFLIELRSFGVAHVEFYEGNGKSLASRNGIGVDRYDFRDDGRVAVLHNPLIDVPAFTAQFEKIKGQKYAFKSLEGFVTGEPATEPNAKICSAMVAYCLLTQPFHTFGHLWPYSQIDPSDFLKTPAHPAIWVDTAHFAKQLSL